MGGGGWRRRTPRRVAALGLAAAGLALLLASVGGSAAGKVPHRIRADGPAPCTTGPPPFPYAGFCATYSGANTWYGSYGPGFPTPLGWAFCADPPASGGDYPAPAYGYVPGGPPAGADTAGLDALGFAFGEAQAVGWWGGSPGQFTADQAAVAGKLLYDSVAWGSPIPAMDSGVLAAFDALDGWDQQAAGATGVPVLSAGLAGGGTSMGSSAVDDLHVQFPGSGRPLVGLGILLQATNATFDDPGGPTSIGLSTDAEGDVTVPVFADGSGTVTLTVVSVTQVGQPGFGFEHATAGPPSAQFLADFPLPVLLSATQTLTAHLGPPPTGTLSIAKSGDDTAYWPLAGALFDVEGPGGEVAAQLETDADGSAGPSTPLAPGLYSLHEQLPPPGYAPAPDRPALVTAGTDTTVSYSGPTEEHVVPGGLTVAKVDASTGAPLAGAVFDVAFDPVHTGTFGEDLGRCTTGPAGTCVPPGNDGPTGLVPGDYRVTEDAAPPGYSLPMTLTQTVTVTPGNAARVVFADQPLGSLQVDKSGDDTSYQSVTGAVFTARGPAPGESVVGTLTVGSDGRSTVLGGLVPGSYTLTETAPPPGYQAIAPVAVAVGPGPGVTVVDVLDHVQPGQLVVAKVDAVTGAPLAGAIFDVAFDADHGGAFGDDLGRCTTGPGGTCSPTGDDGPSGFLPGDYRVTELSAPPGYALATPATQVLTVEPGAVATVTLDDPPLVAATFQKVTTGNVDPGQVVLAGAELDVTAPGGGPAVATCTTGADGRCTTAAVLVAGQGYCWTEPVSPPGLARAAGGCFTARADQAALPVVVSEPGLFVAVAAEKVDAAAPTRGLPGALLALFRMDGGHGPTPPTPPPGAPTDPGGTWMAEGTTGPDGRVAFPLQLPGYAYCVVEATPPPDYTADPSAGCTGVLAGTAAVPAPVITVVLPDAETPVTVTLHKYDAAQPADGVAGATYDLYVAGGPPPSGVPTATPADAAAVPGDAWYGRGATEANGNLSFTVPAGYSWCLLEHRAPPDYLFDPTLHCTGVLTAASPRSATTVAIGETRATVHLSAYKFNSLVPDTGIPGATYELLVQGPWPGPGPAPVPPASAVALPGTEYVDQGTTDRGGNLSFAVPAGFSWCLHELTVPAGYLPDVSFHCSAVLTADTPAEAATVALPEVPAASLAFTGPPGGGLAALGVGLLVAGGLALVAPRRRRGRTAAAAVLVLVGAAGLLVASSSTARADGPGRPDATTPVWWAPIETDYLTPNTLFDASCPSPSMCMAIGDVLGGSPSFVDRFDGQGWSSGGLGDQSLAAVSCPTPSWCMAINHDGWAYTYDGTGWSGPMASPDATPPSDPGPGSFLGGELSCPTADWCAALDERGSVATWTAAGGWALDLVQLHNYESSLPDSPQPTLACVAPGTCEAVVGPDAYAESDGTWSTGDPIAGSTPLERVSCPVAGWCMAVDLAGNAYTLSGTNWSSPRSIDPAGVRVLSCASPSLCLVLDDDQRAVEYLDGTWSAPVTPGSTAEVYEVACAAGTSWCVTLDSLAQRPTDLGDLVALVLAPPAAPTAGLVVSPGTGTAPTGGTLAVTVSPALAGFVGAAGPDQWTATYGWTCTPVPGALPCPPTGTLSAPPADTAGAFGATPTDGTAPAATSPFPASFGPGRYQLSVQLTDTTSGAVADGSATVTVSPASPCPLAVTAVSGDQSTPVGQAFPHPLVARVTCDGQPDPGQPVTFTLPSAGPGATFTGGQPAATATTGSDGTAPSPVLTANATAGPWQAQATVPTAAGPATFALTNTATAPPTTTPPASPPAGPPPTAPPANPAPSPVPAAPATVAPAVPTLAFTGAPGLAPVVAGLGLSALGLRLRRRRRPGSGGPTGSDGPAPPDPPPVLPTDLPPGLPVGPLTGHPTGRRTDPPGARLGRSADPGAPPMPYADIEPHELRQRLAAGEDVYVLDVREDDEVAEWAFPGAHHIPLGQLGDRADEVPRDRQVVVLCAAGVRSAAAAQALDRGGWDAANLAGGVAAWVSSQPG